MKKMMFALVLALAVSVCGAALAAGGAAGGIAMLRGDDADCVERMLRTVLGNVCGMVCDGAKANCAAKAGMALHGAMQALALAEAGLGADGGGDRRECLSPRARGRGRDRPRALPDRGGKAGRMAVGMM